MVATILVPLDGSKFGEQALPLALRSAQAAGGALHLVHAHVPAVAWDLGDGLSAEQLLADQQAQRSERAYLERVAGRLREVANVPVTTALLDAPIADSLEQEAQARQATLIVLTTHGRGPLSRLWLGSVADKLVRQACVPILLVRPQATAPDLGQPAPLRHILIPLDGSKLAESILAPAVALAAACQAGVTLLQVIDPFLPAGVDAEGFTVSGLAPAAMKKLQAQAEGYLTGLANRLAGQAGKVNVRVVVGTRIAETIAEQATALPADLIALATQGQGGLRRLLLGSVADKVVRSATVPVLVCRPASPLPGQE